MAPTTYMSTLHYRVSSMLTQWVGTLILGSIMSSYLFSIRISMTYPVSYGWEIFQQVNVWGVGGLTFECDLNVNDQRRSLRHKEMKPDKASFCGVSVHSLFYSCSHMCIQVQLELWKKRRRISVFPGSTMEIRSGCIYLLFSVHMQHADWSDLIPAQ